MPRFFFDLYDGEHFAPDPQGVELVDAATARDEATRTLTEIAAQEIPGDGPRRLFRIVILDEKRNILSEVRIDFYATQSSASGSQREERRGDHNGE